MKVGGHFGAQKVEQRYGSGSNRTPPSTLSDTITKVTEMGQFHAMSSHILIMCQIFENKSKM